MCNDPNSITITQFFHHYFSNINKRLDVLIETVKDEYETKNSKYMIKQLYLNEVREFIKHNKYKNVIYHYSDIRHSFNFKYYNILYYFNWNFINNLYKINNINLNDIKFIIEDIYIFI